MWLELGNDPACRYFAVANAQLLHCTDATRDSAAKFSSRGKSLRQCERRDGLTARFATVRMGRHEMHSVSSVTRHSRYPMTVCRNLITDVAGLRSATRNASEPFPASPWCSLTSRVSLRSMSAAAAPARRKPMHGPGWHGDPGSRHRPCPADRPLACPAATGVRSFLAERGIGFAVGASPCSDRAAGHPVRPAQRRRQSLGRAPTLRALGAGSLRQRRAGLPARAQSAPGYGATTANLRGGLGSASQALDGGLLVGALVAVNAAGSVTRRHNAPLLGGARSSRAKSSAVRASRRPGPPPDASVRLKGSPGANTTIAVVATNARLTQPAGLPPRRHGADRTCARASIQSTRRSTATPCSPWQRARSPLADDVHGLARLGSARSQP